MLGFLRAFIVSVFVSFASAGAFCANAADISPTFSESEKPETPSYCAATTFHMCGVNFPLPLSQAGTIVQLALPPIYGPFQYAPQPFSVQCVESFAGRTSYQLIDTGGAVCDVPQCTDTEVEVCGTKIPVGGGMTIGAGYKVDIPSDLISVPSSATMPSFNVTCVNPSNPHYVASGVDTISCNDFVCPTAKFLICNSVVTIPGGRPQGTTVNRQMPAPYSNETFSVRCQGNLGRAPAYQITNNPEPGCTAQFLR